MWNSSIRPLDTILSGATTVDQSELGNDGSEEVLCILQSSSITWASQSDCLVSFTEMQSVYSTIPVDWAVIPLWKV